MSRETVIPEQLILPLCEPFKRQADWILDLHAMTQQPNRRAGRCLKCFYTLLEGADERKRKVLGPLKAWIEANIELEIVSNDICSGTLPVRIVEGGFSAFCERVIDQVRDHPCIIAPRIDLKVQYKDSDCAA